MTLLNGVIEDTQGSNQALKRCWYTPYIVLRAGRDAWWILGGRSRRYWWLSGMRTELERELLVGFAARFDRLTARRANGTRNEWLKK